MMPVPCVLCAMDVARMFLADCNRAIARQQEIIATMRSQQQMERGASLLRALQDTREIALQEQQVDQARLIRKLRWELLVGYRQRGEIIANAIHALDRASLATALKSFEPGEVWRCVELYRNWQDFSVAYRWNFAFNGAEPEDLEDALRLLKLWHAQGRPHL